MTVVVLMGIPGSGKSTIALSLRDSCCCEVVTFDAIGQDTDWDDQSFHLIRGLGLKRVAQLLDAITESKRPPSPASTPPLIIVDDLMHLRSMRREVYVLARDRGVPVLIVWVNTPLHIAIERNATRSGREKIDTDVIEKISCVLQPPDPIHVFDRNNIIVDTQCDNESLNDVCCKIVTEAARLWVEAEKTAKNYQAVPVFASPGRPSDSKVLDDKLREITAAAMKLAKQMLPQSALREMGEEFANAKAEVLRCFKIDSLEDGAEHREHAFYWYKFVDLVQNACADKIGQAAVYFTALRALIDSNPR